MHLGLGIVLTQRRGAAAAAPGHRYWRMTTLDIPGDPLEISELRLFEDGVAADSGSTLSAQASPSFGSLAMWQDGNLSNRCNFDATTAEGASFYIKWDLGSGVSKNINGIKQGGFDTASRYLRGFTWQYSDDNSSWTTQSIKAGLTYPGNTTLSALIDVSA